MRPKRSTEAAPDDGIGASELAELSSAALRFREEAEIRWIEHCVERLTSLMEAAGELTAGEENGEGAARRPPLRGRA